jgi:hypothetical protein
MKFEGTQVNIPIKGIMRAGTDNLCADGAMNEVIGMEYKDGSWLPYKEKEEEWEVLEEIEEQWTNVTNIKKVYVHKVSDDSSHYVFLLQDGRVLYEISRDYRPNVFFTSALESDANSIAFVGNLICISTIAGINYYIWNQENGRYKLYQNSDTLNSLPKLSFRVTSVAEDKKINSQGTIGHILYARTSGFPSSFYSSLSAYGWSVLDLASTKDSVAGAAQKAQYMCSEKGRFYGAFLVCYAYRLKSGDYVAASAPVLMNFPSVIINGDTTYPVHLPKAALADVDSSPRFRPGFGSGNAWVDELSPRADEENANLQGTIGMNEYSAYNGEPTASSQLVVPMNTFSNMPSSFAFYYDIHTYSSTESGFPVAGCISNVLQYKINEDIQNIYDDLIDSVCIFVSEQISGYKEFKGSNVYCTGGRKLTAENDYTASYKFQKKNLEDIIDEFAKIKNLYCVESIPFNKIISGDWTSTNLEGKLGDNLYVSDSLPITAFYRDEIVSGLFETYNRRLHVYDYIQKSFKGHTASDFKYITGFGQYPDTGHVQIDAYVKTVIESDDGVRELWTYIEDTSNYLNPVISYPDSEATYIEVYYRFKVEGASWYMRHFDLVSSASSCYAYFIADNLRPIVLDETSGTETTEPTPIDKNKISRYPNRIRVSSQDFATYFPLSNTCTVGNEKIIKLATMAIALSQDTFGKFPMLAFCNDGIYALGVDTSGNGNYTTVTPYSREVCRNAKTVCCIDGAIVFASDKGLMIATQNGVEEFTHSLNGKINFIPDVSSVYKKSARGLYDKIINTPEITLLNNAISQIDFIDELSMSDTVVSYISKNNNLIVYNGVWKYVYIIDIPTRNVTKLHRSLAWDNDNYPNENYWKKIDDDNKMSYTVVTFPYRSENGYVDSLVVSRPIKVQQDDKCSYRVVLTGYYEGILDHWACLVVLGSLDADNWRVIGVKEKKLVGGFHNLGCLTERGSWKYLMFIFAGKLSNNSHIDSIDITVDGRYNNKKR